MRQDGTIKSHLPQLCSSRIRSSNYFALVPALVYGITRFIPIREGQRNGLILLSMAAGSPFLPKQAQVAKGNIAFSVGRMVLLTVGILLMLTLRNIFSVIETWVLNAGLDFIVGAFFILKPIVGEIGKRKAASILSVV